MWTKECKWVSDPFLVAQYHSFRFLDHFGDMRTKLANVTLIWKTSISWVEDKKLLKYFLFGSVIYLNFVALIDNFLTLLSFWPAMHNTALCNINVLMPPNKKSFTGSPSYFKVYRSLPYSITNDCASPLKNSTLCIRPCLLFADKVCNKVYL